MNAKGFQVLIEREHPFMFAFNQSQCEALCEKFEPRCLNRVRRHFMEGGARLCASELGSWFSSYAKETREERLERIRRELEDHWRKLGLLPELAA